MQAENQPAEAAARLERLIARQAQKRHLAPIWAAIAGIAPGMTVLDIGAGTGALALEYAALVGPQGQVLALDPDTASLGHAAAEAARRGLGLRTLIGRAEALPVPPRPPDRIMLSDALHHMADKRAALRAIHAVMPRQARLFIAEYDPDGPGVCGPPHERRLGRAALADLLERAGFSHGPIRPAPDEHYTILAAP